MSEGSALPKKTVLLVDVDSRSRESRSRAMRELGAEVDCAANAATAVSRCQTGSYNLVLVDLGNDLLEAERLAERIKARNPRQRVAFLVGRPRYVASSLRRNGATVQPTVAAKAEPPAVNRAAAGMDFGQRIRDAEAQVDAEAEAKQNPTGVGRR